VTPPHGRPVLTAYIDGGARGNPGPAGYGVHIQGPDRAVLDELHGALGVATNNVAEYNGLLAALQWAKRHGHAALHVKSDSLLLVQQMRGHFKVKHPGLLPLYAKARLLAHDIGHVTFEHVPREMNEDADRLSNLGMDEAEEALKSGG
jgi:ribonuclease HI